MTPKILIAIPSSHGIDFIGVPYRARALAQRQTWIPELRGADVRFFMGGGEPQCGDEVCLPVDDSYAGLPAKTQAICRWAVEHGYDFVFKCDDDTYVRPERLLASGFEAHDYIGRVRGPSGNTVVCPAPYCSGFAYWLSAKALKAVAEAETYGDDAEDRFVGNVLLKAGIHPYHDDRYRIMVAAPNARGVQIGTCIGEPPLPGNNLIAACEFIGPKMLEVHEQWIANQPSSIKPFQFPEGKLSKVCVMIKTFLRDGLLQRCVDGLERFYPECKIVIVDDGFGSKHKNSWYPNLRDRGHACVWLPFDSGFGAKANAALPFCDRPYVLIGSDDFDFSHPSVRTGIEKMVAVLDHDPEIHIVSGRVNGRPYESCLEIGDGWVKEHEGHRETLGFAGIPYKTCDLTVNFSLIRRECLGPNALHWDGGDAKIGQGEHGAFFYDAKKLGYGVAVIEDAHVREMNWDFSVVHPMYPQFRARAKQPGRLCFTVRGIREWHLQGGGIEVAQ